MERLYPWIKRLNTVKVSVFPKMIYSFNEIPVYSLVNVDKFNLKSIWKFNGTRIAKTISKTKNKAEGLSISNFKTCCKAAVVKIGWYWHKDRHMIDRTKLRIQIQAFTVTDK